jgi:hypothetical protein
MTTFASVEQAEAFAKTHPQSPVVFFDSWRDYPACHNIHTGDYKDPIFIMRGADDEDLCGVYRYNHSRAPWYVEYLVVKTGTLFSVSQRVHTAEKPPVDHQQNITA